MLESLREKLILTLTLLAFSAALGWEENAKQGFPRKVAPGVKRDAKKEASELPAFTLTREAAAMKFADQNHRDLKRLLEGLQKKDKVAYESAIRELFAESERMAELQIRDAEMHALALELWKTKSRIDLLAARLKLASSRKEYDEKVLRELIRKQIDLELNIARLEIRRVEKRLEKRKNEVYERETTVDQRLTERFEQLLRKPRVVEAPAGETPSPTPVAPDKEKSPDGADVAPAEPEKPKSETSALN
jgi:hypothetical protein